MATENENDALIRAAIERAALYDDDKRQDIKTDVMNAFYAGAAFAESQASTTGEHGREAHDIAAKIVKALLGKEDADALKFIVHELRPVVKDTERLNWLDETIDSPDHDNWRQYIDTHRGKEKQ